MHRSAFSSAVMLAAVLTVASWVPAPEVFAQEPTVDAGAESVVAFYFHGNVRCATCKKIEAYADEAVQQGFPKSPPKAYPACREYYGDLISLRENLETLRQERGTVAFDKMRKPFDDAFYCIDKKTLKEAQRANKRAVELREWLDELAKRHLHAD